MNVEIDIPGTDPQGRSFLTWAPVEAKARLVDGPANGQPVHVTLRNAGAGGQLVFDRTRTDQGAPTLDIDLPTDGTPVSFWVAGAFQSPSRDYGDTAVEAGAPGVAAPLGSRTAMVRIRKDAQTLTDAERDRFLAAFGTLNGSGAGRFRDFRDMHVSAAIAEAHGNMGFPPWHRAYLLDLERQLQAIDSSVALPYWRFDGPAPNVFTQQFMGESNSAGRVQFTPGHPLETWRTDGQLGINRQLRFATGAAPGSVMTEARTLALGGAAPNAAYGGFETMELNPHGRAHMSFSGFLASIPIAARDPLFFMLHGNVDRLWAKWQWVHRRTDPSDARAFAPADPDRVGHRLNDTMWPWNGVTVPPRPATAPGGGMAPSVVTPAPGAAPTVASMIDYQAVGGGDILGFAYDDVPFEM